MPYSHTNVELTHRFFDYLVANFSKSQVSHALNLRMHPETKQEMVFLSYRVGNHYINFDGVPESSSVVLRTRAKEGIASALQFEILKAVSLLNGAEREAYSSFFGKPGFSEKNIILSPNFPGIETIVEVPFTVPKHYPWILEISAFPTILGKFVKPANDILFQKSKEKST